MQDFKDKIALVTGASRGIGQAIAIELGSRGAHVVCMARTVGGLEETDDKIKEVGGTATLIPADMTKFKELDALGPTLSQKFDHLDIVVGNAGLANTLSPLTHSDPSEWQNVMNINVTANFHLIRTLDPLLLAASHPRGVFVTTSKSLIEGRPYWGAYGVSKAALETLIKTYAAETRETNLRVNLISPGAVATKMRAGVMPGENPETLPTPEETAQKFMPYLAESFDQTGQVFQL